MSNTNNTTAATTVANTTNNLLNDLATIGTIVNHTNRTMIIELFGERIVSENPPKDILLPNGFALTGWSMSIANLVPKLLSKTNNITAADVEKATNIAVQIIQSFLPYAPFATAVKDSDGDITNIILTFKSTSDTNLATMTESLANTDITHIKSILRLDKAKFYSFNERCYIMLDGTRIEK